MSPVKKLVEWDKERYKLRILRTLTENRNQLLICNVTIMFLICEG